MLKIAVLILCLGWTSAEYGCNEKIPDKMRQQIIQFHNDRRAELAKGLTDGANGKLKAASNMYELEWSCALEKEAEKRCKNLMIDTNFLNNLGAATDILKGKGCYPEPLDFKRDFERAMKHWWDEAQSYQQTEENRLTGFNLLNFGNMANGNATKVGCTFEKKGRMTSVLCIYNSRVNKGFVVYQPGEPCKTDDECTLVPKSKCAQNGLCKGTYAHAEKKNKVNDRMK